MHISAATTNKAQHSGGQFLTRKKEKDSEL
jgi:hypothetical protein